MLHRYSSLERTKTLARERAHIVLFREATSTRGKMKKKDEERSSHFKILICEMGLHSPLI